MIRLNLMLLLAVVASALYLVNVQYQSRLLFTALDKLNADARRLQADNEKLQVERQAQATPLRVEKMAKEQLLMRTSTPAISHYVTYGGLPASSSATPVPGSTR
jgi:cell division protein FtsL